MISRSDETDLLEALHAGVRASAPFALFLDRLRQRTRAADVRLVLLRRDWPLARARVIASEAQLPPLGNGVRAWRGLRPNRVYAGSELANATEGDGAPPMRIVRVAVDDLDGWLVIRRTGRDFSGGDVALLSALAPHLAIAIANHAALAEARGRIAIVGRGLARLGVGWIALDREARILGTDAIGARLVRDGSAARRAEDNRLVLVAPRADRLLAAALEDRSATPYAIRLSDAPRVAMLVARVDDAPPAADRVAYVQIGDPPAADLAPVLRTLFDLAPREAKLAALLCRGLRLAEAAVALGLTIETARVYSKALFSRSGTHGQADFVRAALTSIAMLA